MPKTESLLVLIYLFTIGVCASAEFDQNSIDKDIGLPITAKVGRTAFSSVTMKQIERWDGEWRLEVKEVKGWRCTTVTDCLYAYAKARQPDAAIGVLWYWINGDSKKGHALCIFRDGKDIRFYCPSTRKEVVLTADEIRSTYFLMF